MDDEKERLISTIRQIYGGIVWTHKTHEKDREIYAQRATRDKWINVILISFATVVLVLGIVLDKDWGTVVGTIFASLSTLFAAYSLSFSPEKEAQHHREAAKALYNERQCLLLLIERSMAADADLANIRRDLQNITERVNQINGIAPDTSSKAYQIASKALNVDEELTFSTEEIDNLLPPKLRM
jgi:t-SNARE complex subunit (syntaxin)